MLATSGPPMTMHVRGKGNNDRRIPVEQALIDVLER
jgi:hypothetical protein